MTHKSSNHPMQQADTRGRKRAASQAIALPVTTKQSVPASVQLRNEISFNDRIDNFDKESDKSSSESDEENETSIPTSVLAPGIGKKTRSFAGIPDSVQEFKYETAWLTYEKISKTWASHGPRVQELIVSNIKADLSYQIAAYMKIAELEEELHHSYDRLNVPEKPLQPDLDDIYVDPDRTTDEDSDEEGGDNEDEADIEED
ncbi:hypothetical protein BGX38DRAFT_1274633 [Terfezia claveryi]|nr:hypothetical protein BGX38DRAFT_1274633 [Terfezia claveryi]